MSMRRRPTRSFGTSVGLRLLRQPAASAHARRYERTPTVRPSDYHKGLVEGTKPQSRPGSRLRRRPQLGFGASSTDHTCERRSTLGLSVLVTSILGRSILGCSILGRSILGRSISGRSISGRSISGRSISGRSISGRSISGRSILGRSVFGGSMLGRIRQARVWRRPKLAAQHAARTAAVASSKARCERTCGAAAVGSSVLLCPRPGLCGNPTGASLAFSRGVARLATVRAGAVTAVACETTTHRTVTAR